TSDAGARTCGADRFIVVATRPAFAATRAGEKHEPDSDTPPAPKLHTRHQPFPWPSMEVERRDDHEIVIAAKAVIRDAAAPRARPSAALRTGANIAPSPTNVASSDRAFSYSPRWRL